MKRIICTFLTYLVGLHLIFAQNIENFDGLYSKGPVIKRIVTPVYISYEEALSKELSSNEERDSKKTKEKFLLESNYYINKFLVSENLVFNDTISNYLNQVKKVLLKDYPDLVNKITIYTIKTPLVNALATNEGIIFVTTGLLEKVENEAQLAYILSHEISHYVKKHLINAYVEKMELIKKSEKYKRASTEENFKILAERSREHETEADEYAYIFFANTQYNSKAPSEAFQILKNSHIPYAIDSNIHKTLELDTLLPTNYFPKINFQKEKEKKEEEDNVVDLHSSHPNIESRINKADSLFNKLGKNEVSTKKYIISEDWFKYCRNISRMINAKRLLDLELYGEALYYTYLLEKEFGKTNYIAKLKTRAVYELAKFDVNGARKKTNISYGIDVKEFNTLDKLVLAYNICNKNMAAFPKEVYFEKVMKDLIIAANIELKYHKVGLETIFQKEAIKLKEVVDNSRISKSEGIYQKYNSEYLKYNSIPRKRKDRKTYLTYYSENSEKKNSIIFLDPTRNHFTAKKGFLFINSEKETKTHIETLKSLAKQKSFDIHILSHRNLLTIDKLNDRVILIDYVNNALGDDKNFIPFNISKLEAIMTKYKTNYVALSSMNINEFNGKEYRFESTYYWGCSSIISIYNMKNSKWDFFDRRTYNKKITTGEVIRTYDLYFNLFMKTN